MYQFFVEDEQVQQDRICIVGGDVNHIGHVLRMKTGEKIRISDQSGRSYFCRILEITEEEVWAQIEDTDEMGTEFSHKVYLFQGLPKSDKMELIIQKTVELGVYTVIPVAMKNCVVKLDEKKAQSKCKRWQAIAESAAKQSKRTVIPQIQMPLSWKQALEEAKELDVVLVPYENERGMEATREIFRSIPEGASIGVMIGPEGGFSPEEIAQLQIISPQGSYDFVVEAVEGEDDERVTCNGQPVDRELFDKLYQAVTSIPPERMSSGQPELEPALTMTVSYRDNSRPEDRFELIPNGNGSVYLSLNGKIRYTASQQLVYQILQNCQQVLEGKEVSSLS